MNWKWWNNEIICIVLGINHRYFSSKKIQYKTSSYSTQTSYFLNPSLTIFLFTPLVIHTQHRHEPRKTYVCNFVPVYWNALSFPVCFSLWRIENFYMVFPAVLHTHIADCWLRNEYSVRLVITKLEQVVTHWNATLFQLLYGSSIYRRSVYFYISNSSWYYKPSGVSHVSISRDLARQAVNADIYLVGRNYCILFISFFKLSYLNWAETELKCNTGIRENITIGILSYTDNCCLVPFSSNISCHFKNIKRVLLWLQKGLVSVGGVESGVHSKKILIRSLQSQI